MKCPNCSAELGSKKICDYCGSQITVESLKEQELINKKGCPKCNSTNIQFRRENQGEVRGKKSKKVIYKTVGFCKDCGATWMPQSQSNKKRRTWLWVLGWIYIFPVPLTILMVKNTKIIKWLRMTIIAIAWLLYIAFFIAVATADTSANATNDPNVSSSEIVNEQVTEQSDIVYNQKIDDTTISEQEDTSDNNPYADNEQVIRQFVNQYNQQNDQQITDIEWKNNHTVANISFDDKIGDINTSRTPIFSINFDFTNGLTLVDTYDDIINNIVSVLEPSVGDNEINTAIEQAKENDQEFIKIGQNTSIQYHYVELAVGFNSADRYMITISSSYGE